MRRFIIIGAFIVFSAVPLSFAQTTAETPKVKATNAEVAQITAGMKMEDLKQQVMDLRSQLNQTKREVNDVKKRLGDLVDRVDRIEYTIRD